MTTAYPQARRVANRISGMRTTFLTVLAMGWACGSADTGGGTPYSAARSEMCGEQPTGVWHIDIMSAPHPIQGQTEQQCMLMDEFEWDFAATNYINTYDQGCALQSTIVRGDGAEIDDLEVMWSAADKWTGTIRVNGSIFGTACVSEADVTLTP